MLAVIRVMDRDVGCMLMTCDGVNYEVYGLYGPEVQCMAGSSVMLAADLFCANDG